MQEKTIRQIKEFLHTETASVDDLKRLAEDRRESVRKLVKAYMNRSQRKAQESARLQSMWTFEKRFSSSGYRVIAGVDEAGRGPLAGPVLAAAVVLPEDARIEGLNDSKLVSPLERERMYEVIYGKALDIGVGMTDVTYIDTHNILQATYEAMRRALAKLRVYPDVILNDAVTIPGVTCRQEPIIKGDQKSASIAAASIIAKVTRDRYMYEVAQKYPEYGFERHMGYGTPEHLNALSRYGVTPLHRLSFAPVTQYLAAASATAVDKLQSHPD